MLRFDPVRVGRALWLDDDFDDAVPVVFDQIECLLGFFHAESMGHHEVQIRISPGDEVDRGWNAVILPADVLNSDLLAAEPVGIEGDEVGLWNADDQKLSARLEKFYGLVQSRLIAAAFENGIHPRWLDFQNSLDDVCPVWISYPDRTGVS